MNILSLFDGMSCGYLALQKAGIPIDRYDAYEIDKYALQVSKHNFPNIIQHGDVFNADFSIHKNVDILMGGSPCTYWSIAQKNNRETEASGIGWELFSQYVRALHEVKPKFFVYENNKSMSNAIRQSITETFGFEPILINSALVSAQSRQRLYWVGKINDNGKYTKVNIEQPKDKGILLKDILNCGSDLTSNEKSWTLTASYNGAVPWNTIERSQRNMVAEPVRIPEYGNNDKSRPLNAGYGRLEVNKWYDRVYSTNKNKQQHDYVAIPVYVGEMPNHKGKYRNGNQCSQQYRVYSIDGKSICCNTGGRNNVAIPVKTNVEPNYQFGDIKVRDGIDNYKVFAEPCEWNEDGIPTKAISYSDGKTYTVYEVKNHQIVIKGKTYPIKLNDGYYIIRKLTVEECKRLQTVPEWYDFSVISDSQAYKCLGNGWTVDVISHLLNYCK